MKAFKQIKAIVLSGILLIVLSCTKNSGADYPDVTNKTTGTDVIFRAALKGSSETPPNNSAYTGNATLTFNKDTRKFTITVTFDVVNAIAAHIHKGAPGISGDAIFEFNPPITSPVSYTSAALDSAEEADLNANLYYVNIHSVAFPNGEIRGQLLKQ